jgi:hypothetical protein
MVYRQEEYDLLLVAFNGDRGRSPRNPNLRFTVNIPHLLYVDPDADALARHVRVTW